MGGTDLSMGLELLGAESSTGRMWGREGAQHPHEVIWRLVWGEHGEHPKGWGVLSGEE